MRKFCQQGNDGGQNRKAFFEFSRNWTPDLLIINLRRIRCLFRILKNIFRKTSYTRDMSDKIIKRTMVIRKTINHYKESYNNTSLLRGFGVLGLLCVDKEPLTIYF